MIFVQRPAAPPASLDLENPDSAGARELAEARQHYNDTGERPPVSHFEAYARADVKAALTALFHGKCAYCESKVSGSSQTDIEHYRPKGGVEGQPDHQGYWWLAMRWDNLVLSCMHCNQHRRQLILDPEMSEAEIEAAIIANDLETTGKKNAFPTEDGNHVTEPDTGVQGERPLLIDPTVTDPEPLFDWTSRDERAMIMPRNGDARAETTKDVLGLNRRWLCEQRMTVLADLALSMESLRAMVAEIGNAATDGEARIAQMAASQHLRAIARKCGAREPHAAIARKFLAQARNVLADATQPA